MWRPGGKKWRPGDGVQERLNGLVATFDQGRASYAVRLWKLFTIAVAVGNAATSNATVGVFPPLASTENLPAVQTSFASTSSVSLTQEGQ